MASATAPYTIKWGIMATGLIADLFAKDLLCDPATRDVHDVRHQIVAVASSGSQAKCDRFLENLQMDGGDPAARAAVKTYGSYPELVADRDVDIVYVASPHSHHFQNCMLAMEAGKHVLCEKALTVTAAQARKLVDYAAEKKLFFMEAVWTRFFPLSVKLRELIAAGEIGTVHRVVSDFSINWNADNGKDLVFSDGHRMVRRELAGGTILDQGVYALLWIFQALYHLQPEADKEAPNVVALCNKYYKTDVDESTAILCQFPRHGAMGIATSSMRVDTDPYGTNVHPAARIQGTKGEIQVMAPAYAPTQLKVVKRLMDAALSGVPQTQVFHFPIPQDPKRPVEARGMAWEADECARCVRDGKLQSDTIPWEESVAVQKVLEEAWRQCGIEYPELITTDVYDAKSPLNTGNQ